jgi:predicted nucleic acid-binding Zn ribbon protein
MLYDYRCSECKTKFEVDFPMGEAKKKVLHSECGNMAKRTFGCNFILPDPSKFNREMTERNRKAGERQKDNIPPVRLKALDYGNGDVREVKK